MTLTKQEAMLLLWLLEKTREWQGSYLPEDPALAVFKERLETAQEIIERLINV